MLWTISTLFDKAMWIQNPRFVKNSEFSNSENLGIWWELHIYIDFHKWAEFEYEWKKYKAYDTKKKVYRHLNFFQHKTFLHIRTPRVKTSNWIRQVVAPMVRKWSWFTLLMEAYILQLVKFDMAVKNIWELIWVNDTKIWEILKTYSIKGRENIDMSEVKRIWVDETSKKKWHNYISPIVDMDEKDILHIAEWKKSDVLLQFAKDLFKHWWDSENITEVSMDLWPAFKKWADTYFWKAEVVYDKFHVIQLVNKTVDDIRKRVATWDKSLKKTKLLFLMNEDKLKDKQKTRLKEILKDKIEIAEAYSIRELVQDVYKNSSIYSEADLEFNTLLEIMEECEIKEIKKLTKSLKKHKKWILNFRNNWTTNAILEWMNSKIQTIKKVARWFRNIEYFKSIIYIRLWRLNLSCINHLLAI